MDERIKEAEGWVSMKLSDKEAKEFNKRLGIENEVLQAIEEEKQIMKAGKNDKLGKKKNSRDYLSKLDMGPDYAELGKLKGFLEMNPFMCPGCGAPFQSKAESNPGFLPKDMFAEHRRRSELTKSIQEAIKLLTMAGLELGSTQAATVLRAGEVSEEVIAGVQKIALNNRIDEDRQTELQNKKERNEARGVSGENSDIDREVMEALENFDLEAYRNRYAKFNKNKRHTEAAVTDHTATAAADGTEGEVAVPRKRVPAVAPLPDNATVAAAHQLDPDAVCICQRCFRLQQYGAVDSSLRPGWSASDLLTPERFESLLTTIKDTPSVVLCIVDIFDLRGSILPNLRNIVGTNPIVIAANKIDLLPVDVSLLRVQSWIHNEIKQICGYRSPRDEEESGEYAAGIAEREGNDDNEEEMYFGPSRSSSKYDYSKYGSNNSAAAMGGSGKIKKEEREAGILRRNNVHLVSCQTGMGMDTLLSDLMQKATTHGSKIHVMGAANVGKSSFINRLLDTSKAMNHAGLINNNRKGKRGSKASSRNVAQATVSNLPGTTLDFIKMKLPNGVTMIDTPGLLTKGQLTSKLNSEELRQIIPAKPINPITLRVVEGKTILIGGVARVELLEGRPFFFTFFTSSEVKLHVTQTVKVEDFIQKHVGELVLPPASLERYNEIGPYSSQDLEISGDSWKKSSYDIVIAGLGWISVTGPGTAIVRVTTPVGTTVGLRPALLPYEAPLTTVKFSGGRLMRKGAVKRRPSSQNSLAAVGKGALGMRALRSNKPATNKVRKFGESSGSWKKPSSYGGGDNRGSGGAERSGFSNRRDSERGSYSADRSASRGYSESRDGARSGGFAGDKGKSNSYTSRGSRDGPSRERSSNYGTGSGSRERSSSPFSGSRERASNGGDRGYSGERRGSAGGRGGGYERANSNGNYRSSGSNERGGERERGAR
eukprot:gene12834-14817_t